MFGHILWGYSLKFRPYIGLIYGRYLQFRFLKFPLKQAMRDYNFVAMSSKRTSPALAHKNPHFPSWRKLQVVVAVPMFASIFIPPILPTAHFLGISRRLGRIFVPFLPRFGSFRYEPRAPAGSPSRGRSSRCSPARQTFSEGRSWGWLPKYILWLVVNNGLIMVNSG